MKLCDITQFWSPVSGGVRRYVGEKVKYLRALGGRHVLIIPGERDEVTGDDAARVYTIASPRVSRVTGYRVLLRLGEVDRILAAERPDLVESGDPYQVGWRTAAACARLGIPAVAFYHSHFAESEVRPLASKLGGRVGEWSVELAARYARALYRRFARTLVPSPQLKETLTQWGIENAVTVDMGVDTERFLPGDKTEARFALGLPQDARVLLYVGRLALEKNTRLLCEAFRQLRRTSSAYRLIIAGEGLQRPSVEALAVETGAVLFRPFLTEHAGLLQLFHAADLFVHPGVQETFGLVTAEAQACGLPVIGFHGTAMDRVVRHTREFWAREQTALALAAAIEAAFTHDLPALGEASARAVARVFSWPQVFARQFDLYREVLHKPQSL